MNKLIGKLSISVPDKWKFYPGKIFKKTQTPMGTETKFPLVASPLEMLKEFHTAFGADIDVPFTLESVGLRGRLITEEHIEVNTELFPISETEENAIDVSLIDKKKLAKELADLLYVTYGTAVAFGIDLDEVFRRVHASNMSKLGDDGKPVYREDGKVMKGPNYKEPNFDDIL